MPERLSGRGRNHRGATGEYLSSGHAARRLGLSKATFLRLVARLGMKPRLQQAGHWPRWHVEQLAEIGGEEAEAGDADDDGTVATLAKGTWH